MTRLELDGARGKRFWTVDVIGDLVVVHAGQAETLGTTLSTTFDDDASAQAAAARMVKDKLRHGYQEVGPAPAPRITVPAAVPPSVRAIRRAEKKA